jgi:hypothetical protein
MAGVGRKSRATRVHTFLADVDDLGTTGSRARFHMPLTRGAGTNKI